MDWINKIKDVVLQKRYSQLGEEAIISYVFNHINTTNKYFVDFGAGDGFQLSNTRLLKESDWTGLMMDGDNKGNSEVKEEFITAENIISLFDKYNVPKEFDFLSIDIDGNDFWVLKAILESEYSPRLIINEFNGCIDEGLFKIMKYNENHTWGNNDYYGASFESFKELLKGNKDKNIMGYTLVHQIGTTNMVFIREDIVSQKDYNVTYRKAQYHPHSPNREWTNEWYWA